MMVKIPDLPVRAAIRAVAWLFCNLALADSAVAAKGLEVPAWTSLDLITRIEDLAIDPQNPSKMFGLEPLLGVIKSLDGGRNWQSLHMNLPRPLVPDGKIRVTAGERPAVYAMGETVLLKSLDEGATWRDATPRWKNLMIHSLAISPNDASKIFLGSNHNGVFRSVNGGRTWMRFWRGLPREPIIEMAVAQQSPSTIYAVLNGQMAKSTDQGMTWSTRNLPFDIATSFVVDPNDAATLYATTWNNGTGSVFRSTDAGQSWQALPWFQTRQASTVSVAQGNPPRLFAVYRDDMIDPAGQKLAATYMASSQDGGEHWQVLSSAIDTDYVDKMRIDPLDSSRLYVPLAGGTSAGALLKSDDGGASWAPSGCLADGSSSRMVGDPAEVAVVYLVNPSFGVCKSTNGGASFHPANAGLPRGITDLTLVAGTPPTLLARTEQFGTYRSDDGGISWQSTDETFFKAIVIDPRQPMTRYAAPLPEGSNVTGQSGNPSRGLGVYSSADGGANWSPLALDGYVITALAIDPAQPDNLYASHSRGIFTSTDRGLTWRSPAFSGFPGLREADGEWIDVAFDPENPAWMVASRLNSIGPGYLLLSQDGGENWSELTAIPGSGVGTVAIGADHRLYVNVENQAFTSGPVLSLGEIGGGGYWNPGMKGSIRWRATGGKVSANSRLDIDYSRDDGMNWNRVIKGVKNTGKFQWTPSVNDISDTARLRVCLPRTREREALCDVSFRSFMIR